MIKTIKFNMELKLSECEKNKDYVISKIMIKEDEIKHRLKCLGFLEKEKIKVLNNNYGNTCYLIKVMGVNYAVDKTICDGIVVSV